MTDTKSEQSELERAAKKHSFEKVKDYPEWDEYSSGNIAMTHMCGYIEGARWLLERAREAARDKMVARELRWVHIEDLERLCGEGK